MYQSLKERGPSGGSFNERESYLFFTIPDQTQGVIQIEESFALSGSYVRRLFFSMVGAPEGD